tara:strand:+ start:117 stop:494 length:378 start_codon:yes stop_codon:yes gene_type:complete
MGGMTKVDHKNHTVARGFLLPQGSSVTQLVNPIELTINPVPFDTHLNVDFSTAVSGDLSIRLLDVTGRLVFDIAQTGNKYITFSSIGISLHNAYTRNDLVMVSDGIDTLLVGQNGGISTPFNLIG